jgi:two-component system, NarL family, sensor histidine kinase UhpB
LPQSLPLYSKVCLIDGAVLVAATSLQVVSPAAVSNRVTGGELAVLAIGLAVLLATNATLVYSSLPSVDQLIRRLGKFDTDAPPEKRDGRHSLRLRVVGEGQQWR